MILLLMEIPLKLYTVRKKFNSESDLEVIETLNKINQHILEDK